MVQFRGKCQSPSDVENAFERVEWRCNVSKQGAGCKWEQGASGSRGDKGGWKYGHKVDERGNAKR